MKFSTFAITIRFRDGITDDEVIKTTAFIKKKSEHYYVITEKEEDQRHIHAGIILKKPTTRPNLCTEFVRLFKNDHDSEELSVLRKGIKVMYSYDFISNYMTKGDSTVVIDSNMPEQHHIEHYFPAPLETVKERHALQHHKMMKDLESLWYEHMAPHVEINTMNVRDFLFNMQYNERKIGLMDDKKMFQVSRWLTRWMNKVDNCKLELPPFEKEEGPGFH